MERPRRINVATCSAGPLLGVLSARATLVWVADPDTARALSAFAHSPTNEARRTTCPGCAAGLEEVTS